jgi:hypothetical protein
MGVGDDSQEWYGRCFERRLRDRGDWARMAVTAARRSLMSGYE